MKETCNSVNPETGKKCGCPKGHETSYQCSNGPGASWKYNPPKTDNGKA